MQPRSMTDSHALHACSRTTTSPPTHRPSPPKLGSIHGHLARIDRKNEWHTICKFYAFRSAYVFRPAAGHSPARGPVSPPTSWPGRSVRAARPPVGRTSARLPSAIRDRRAAAFSARNSSPGVQRPATAVWQLGPGSPPPPVPYRQPPNPALSASSRRLLGEDLRRGPRGALTALRAPHPPRCGSITYNAASARRFASQARSRDWPPISGNSRSIRPPTIRTRSRKSSIDMKCRFGVSYHS